MARVWKRKDIKKGTWYAHFTVNGKRYRVKLDAQNKEQANKMAAEIEYQVLRGNFKVLEKFNPITLQELSDKYLKYAKSNKKSWKRDEVSLKNILNMDIDNKRLGDYYIDAIKVVHIQKYQIRRKRELGEKYDKKGIAEREQNFATVNRELACLRHIFYMAIEWELLTKNPVANKAIKFDKEKSRNRTLNDDEYKRLLSVCTDHLYQIVVIALNTGMRLGEILSLEWENIDMENRKIIVKYTKTDVDREIPVNDFLFEVLQKLPQKGLLFTNRSGKKLGSIKTAWRTAMKKSKIEDFRFHDLRHTVATRLAKAKVTESVIAMILGHARPSITSRYINPDWDEMQEAVEVLGNLCHELVTDGSDSESVDISNSNENNTMVQCRKLTNIGTSNP